MTKKLWLTDSYLREFEATVQKVSDGKFIVLDKTAFYPQSGGQPHDTGRIISGIQEFGVVFSKKFGGEVSHEVDKQGLREGMQVKCFVDWERRYRHMRMHSAAHIVHGVIFNEMSLLVSGNQLGWPQSRIDINIKDFDRERFSLIEQKCNEVIAKNLEVTARFISPEEAATNPDFFRLMGVGREELIKNLGSEIRIVKIGGFDESIDGGTHVKNTSEIGRIHFARFENKGAENRRIYFELGDA